MSFSSLTENEFRLLAYIRAYADRQEQHLDPGWVQEQLEFTVNQLQEAARGLVAYGLATFFEWRLSDAKFIPPEFGDGPMPMDIQLTSKGWNYLRNTLEA